MQTFAILKTHNCGVKKRKKKHPHPLKKEGQNNGSGTAVNKRVKVRGAIASDSPSPGIKPSKMSSDADCPFIMAQQKTDSRKDENREEGRIWTSWVGKKE